MSVDGVVSSVLDLSSTPVGGESSSGRNKIPRAMGRANFPTGLNLFGQMPTPRMDEEVWPGLLSPSRMSQMSPLCHCSTSLRTVS
jgi:hypothetical protein